MEPIPPAADDADNAVRRAGVRSGAGLERRCPICGEPLAAPRADAETCDPSCRRERSGLRAILGGLSDGPYLDLHQYQQRRRRRAKRARGDVG